MTPHLLLALSLALLIGVLLGAMGSGGSIITLPVLVYVGHIAPRAAVGMSMAIVGVTSAAAAYLHGRRGNFHRQAALLLGISGIAGAYLGSGFTQRIPTATLMLVFAALMLLVGSLMLRGGVRGPSSGVCNPVLCGVVGFIVGVLTGLLGVGGGFLLVPALVFFAGLDTKRAVGTSLAIIAVNSAAGFFGQLRYGAIDLKLTALFIVFALLGMWGGLTFATRAPEAALRKAFAGLLLVVGVTVGIRNL